MSTISLEVLDDDVFMALEKAISEAEAAASNGSLRLPSPPPAKKTRTCHTSTYLLHCTTTRAYSDTSSTSGCLDTVIGHSPIAHGNLSTSNNCVRKSGDADDNNGGRGRNGNPPGLHASLERRAVSEQRVSPLVSSKDNVATDDDPYLRFRNRIIYTRTMSEGEEAASDLLRRLESEKAAKGASLHIGFDAEWKVDLATDDRGKVAVVQLCMDAMQCEVFHLAYSGVPSSLRIILEDPSFIKVGLGAKDDAEKLRSDYHINVQGVEDLAMFAESKLGPARRSLASLTNEVLGKLLDKNKKIRCGNWEAPELSEAQLQYAATDAFASLYLYQKLSRYMDLRVNLSCNKGVLTT